MSEKKYYKQGERLEGLKQDIQFILNHEPAKPFLFMKKEHYDNFLENIKKPIIELHDVLLRTVIDNDEIQIKNIKVSDACKKVVDFLKQNVVDDLGKDFYEEKLKLYNGLYFDFIENNLIKGYPSYDEILGSITHEYIQLRSKVIDSFDFSKYTSLTTLYKQLKDGLKTEKVHYVFTTPSIDYIYHCAELLIEEIQNMLAKEMFKQESNTTRYKRIRKLIYVLKHELKIDFEKEKL